MNSTNLFLIGYRGTGKTTVARLLAERLGVAWLDVDLEIEQQAGKSIAEIFRVEGEAGFREREAAAIANLALGRAFVVALGGGAVVREENRRVIRQATVIWLTAASQTIVQRLAQDPRTEGQRPDLTQQGGLPEIELLLSQREPQYRECADYTIDTEGKTADQVAAEIVSLVRPGWSDQSES